MIPSQNVITPVSPSEISNAILELSNIALTIVEKIPSWPKNTAWTQAVTKAMIKKLIQIRLSMDAAEFYERRQRAKINIFNSSSCNIQIFPAAMSRVYFHHIALLWKNCAGTARDHTLFRLPNTNVIRMNVLHLKWVSVIIADALPGWRNR
ncbi:MAG: hypothetical protein ACOH2B_11750 [Burkholderiaceae bacterium]